MGATRGIPQPDARATIRVATILVGATRSIMQTALRDAGPVDGDRDAEPAVVEVDKQHSSNACPNAERPAAGSPCLARLALLERESGKAWGTNPRPVCAAPDMSCVVRTVLAPSARSETRGACFSKSTKFSNSSAVTTFSFNSPSSTTDRTAA